MLKKPLFLVFIGPDGCGKTTIATELMKRMPLENYGEIELCEMNFGILPSLSQLLKWLSFQNFKSDKNLRCHAPGEYLAGMRHRPLSSLRCVLLATWYGFDYVLGYWRLLRASSQRKTLIFTRYFHDYLYQRAYTNMPYWYLKVWSKVIPQPTLTFFLCRRPEAIFSQKPELSLTEIDRQNKQIGGVVSNLFPVVTVAADNGIEDCVDLIERIVASRCGF